MFFRTKTKGEIEMNLKEEALKVLKSDEKIVATGVNLELLADLIEPKFEAREGSTLEEIEIQKDNHHKLINSIKEAWNPETYAENAYMFVNRLQTAKREGQDVSWLDAIPNSEEIFKNLKI